MPTEICRMAAEISAAQSAFQCKNSHAGKITRTKFKTKDKIFHSRVVNMENSLGILDYTEEIQIPRNWESIMGENHLHLLFLL